MHIPVLLKEVIDGLDFKEEDKIFVDLTLGDAGHSLEICRKFPWIKIIGLDVDKKAALRSQGVLEGGGCKFEIVNENFRNLDEVLSKLRTKKIDEVLFDLGFSSDQIESSGRGFSFQKDEPLIMTLRDDWQGSLTAFEIVNSWPKVRLEQILREYSEESWAPRIAEAIVRRRKQKVIRTTRELVDVIEESLPSGLRQKKIHPATKTFQALRIAVNDELESLKVGLKSAWDNLRVGGRLAVISFHSLEDRIVKNFFRDLKNKQLAHLITKKPITPSREEIIANRRSRSAKLRIIEKNFHEI